MRPAVPVNETKFTCIILGYVLGNSVFKWWEAKMMKMAINSNISNNSNIIPNFTKKFSKTKGTSAPRSSQFLFFMQRKKFAKKKQWILKRVYMSFFQSLLIHYENFYLKKPTGYSKMNFNHSLSLDLYFASVLCSIDYDLISISLISL